MFKDFIGGHCIALFILTHFAGNLSLKHFQNICRVATTYYKQVSDMRMDYISSASSFCSPPSALSHYEFTVSPLQHFFIPETFSEVSLSIIALHIFLFHLKSVLLFRHVPCQYFFGPHVLRHYLDTTIPLQCSIFQFFLIIQHSTSVWFRIFSDVLSGDLQKSSHEIYFDCSYFISYYSCQWPYFLPAQNKIFLVRAIFSTIWYCERYFLCEKVVPYQCMMLFL